MVYNAAINNNLQNYKHKPSVAKAVRDVIKPAFADLSHPELLKKCLGGKIQNSNESLNSLIWKFCPKTIDSSLHITEIAANLATSVFNDGNQILITILEKFGLKINRNVCVSLAERDNRRSFTSRQRRLESSFEARRAKKIKKSKEIELFQEQYLENSEDRSVNATICENWSRDFRLIEGLLFYAKHATSLGEMRVYTPKSLRNEIMRQFHHKPLAGHFGRFKTYHKIRDVCYFPYMRKFIDQYVSTCPMCQINNYKNALPAGRLIPIVSNYPNEIVTLDLLGPYPVSGVRSNRYVLVITDHFSKWAEIIPLKKASARVIADKFFDNYISRFGAPIKLISDNGPQFISDIFENLSERLGIRHVKTVVYRPQANRTERVNRDLVQMIANYVNEQHDTWDQFLREFAYAIRTAVNETTGHLLGRALYWYQIFGSALVQTTATDFAQLKAGLSKAFPAIQNWKDLETRFYASQQRQNQEPTDFVYDLLKLHKKLELGMSEKTLVDHIFVRLEPQVQDYGEVRNPQTAIQLLEVLAKFEERYLCKATLGSRNSNNVEGRGWNERRMSNVGSNRGNWRNSEVVLRLNNGRNDYKGNYQNNRQGNQWIESRNWFQNNDRRFNDTGYQFRNRGQNDDFNRGAQRNRCSSENFSRGSRKQMGRLNVLKVSDIKGDQTQSINQSPIKLSAICMSPVELPYVPILLDETFTKALWDTGAEKSFISEETYLKYFFYKPVKKSRTQVITAQEAKCQNIGVGELTIRIREFEKPGLFHVLADLEYPCILGINFIGGSKIILDFD
ncbi:retrovirus-related Pol polyprotein from transposon 412 [Trichonephila clavipes]|nr:retrovirus-related Pol polyprotein from transposon 412 [Trichonephila clavipes]